MSEYTPKPLPPAPNQSTKSIFDLKGANTFPEAVNVPLQYAEIPSRPKLLQPNMATEQTSTVSPAQYSEPLYFTPPVHGGAVGVNYGSPHALPFSFKSTSTIWKTISGISLGLVGLLVLIALTLASLSAGTIGGVIATFLACIPFIVVFACIIWVGKWDAEPWGIRIPAFLWGAGLSVVLTLIISTVWAMIAGQPASMFESVAIQAPIIEELAKGLGVLVIALFLKRYLDGPVDGIVYVATIAAGFAFTENILYFSAALTEGGFGSLTMTFFLRAIMSPFAHIVFSLPMGILVGVARRQGWSIPQIIGVWVLGYVPAVLLHSLWNASASLIEGEMWYLFYAVVQVPIFVIAIVTVIWLRKAEAKITFKRLTEYGWAGWFTPQEVDSFATWEGRKAVNKWAKTKSPQAGEIMKQITKDVVVLSNVREKISRGKAAPSVIEHEQELLNRISTRKNFLLTL